jgi:hypothetical protein
VVHCQGWGDPIFLLSFLCSSAKWGDFGASELEVSSALGTFCATGIIPWSPRVFCRWEHRDLLRLWEEEAGSAWPVLSLGPGMEHVPIGGC